MTVTANVTCKVNAQGGTVVTADYCGSKFADTTFDDYNVDRDGYSAEFAARITAALTDQIADALREAS
jgi:hypothetical protein